MSAIKAHSLTSLLRNLEHCNSAGITIVNGSEEETFHTYGEVYSRALVVLHNLNGRGVREGCELVIQIEDSLEFITAFWACVLGKIIPVPLQIGVGEEYKHKLIRVWRFLNDPFLLCEPGYLERLNIFGQRSGNAPETEEISKRALLVPDLRDGIIRATPVEAASGDLCYIQFSSGSTGNPKGITLSHGNLLANIEDITSRSEITSRDKTLSWMPLTHDMGMISFHLTSLANRIDQYVIPTARFIRNPLLWIQKADEHKASVLYSPNFGYKYFLSAFKSPVKQWDLRNVRLIYNGAELVSAGLCTQFYESLKEFGLRPNVIFPAYGLAEASVGVTLPTMDAPLRTYALDRSKLNIGKKVSMISRGMEETGFSLVALGFPLDHCTLRISDDAGDPLPEMHLGHIQIKGDNVTSGYYNNPGETARLFTGDGWLKTKDIGFVVEGNLVFVTRQDNVIVINGQNYFPDDIERLIFGAGEADLGKVCACGVAETKGDVELVIFILFKGPIKAFLPLTYKVRERVKQGLGIIPHRVIPVKKIPKTTSGKVQYFKLVEQYRNNAFVGELKALEELEREAIEGPSLLDRLAGLAKTLLGVQHLDPDGDLFAMGLNSMLGIRYVARVQEELKIDMTVTDLFRSPTVQSLAEWLVKKQSLNAGEPVATDIRDVNEVDYSDASDDQRRIWTFVKSINSAAFNISLAYLVEGQLDAKEIEASLQTIVARHESLRTTFHAVEGRLRQRVHPAEEVSVNTMRSECSALASDGEIELLVRKNADHKFDLSTWPLFRLDLMTIGAGKFIFQFTIHHIISDGWSLENIFREFTALYNSPHKALRLPELKYQLRDFVAWQRKSLRREAERNLSYWKEELSDSPGFALKQSSDGVGGSAEFAVYPFSRNAVDALNRISKANNATRFTSILALLDLLFSRYTGQRDVLIGTVLADREQRYSESQIGYFLTTVPLRVYVDSDASFSALIDQVKEKLVRAFAHKNYSFSALNQHMNAGGTKGIFNVLVLYQDFHFLPFSEIPGVSAVRNIPVDNSDCLVDLQLDFYGQNANDLRVHVKYDAGLYSKQEVSQLLRRLEHLIMVIEERPLPLKAYEILTAEEREHLLGLSINDAASGDASNGSIIDRLAAQVCAAPGATALLFKDKVLTYEEVWRRSDQLAGIMQHSYGIAPGSRVALLLTPGEDLVISIIAVLKLRATYVPVDTLNPVPWISKILTDARTDLLCTYGKFMAGEFTGCPAMLLDEPLPKPESIITLTSAIEGSDLAYIAYTSGSTGQAKGVMIGHGSLVDYVNSFAQFFSLSGNDTVIQQASIAFDTHVEEIFPILICGGKIAITEHGGKDIRSLTECIRKNKATLLSTTPLILQQLNEAPEELESLRTVISGGDVLKAQYVDRLFRMCPVYNTYGPTETTVCASYHKIESLDEVSLIGKPIANRQMFILDDDLNLMPPGAIGEIYIGGKGLAKGYVNQAEETRRCFIQSPFRQGELLYRTGDLGRWDNEALIFAGRSGSFIKARGHRIEPKQIEESLMRYGGIEDVIVRSLKNHNSTPQLVAYYVAKKALSPSSMRAFLSKRIPYYMVPDTFIRLRSIPMTSNGKIDHVALPLPEMPHIARSMKRKPSGVTETALLNIWKKILKIEAIDVKDRFFEIGGNSMHATMLAHMIQDIFNVRLEFHDVFIHDTVRKLAKIIGKRVTKIQDVIPVAAGRSFYPASNSQKRLWVLHELDSNEVAYNMSWICRISGALDIDTFDQAFHTLIDRHEILRTTFSVTDGSLVQVIAPKDNRALKVEVHDLGSALNFDGEIRQLIETRINSPFNLEVGPLVRSVLVRRDNTNFTFLLSMHHIIADAWSVEVFMRELKIQYEALREKKPATLPELTIQYKDFVQWQAGGLEKRKMQQSRKFWLSVFANGIPVLNLPLKQPRRAVKTYNGGVELFSIPDEVRSLAKELAAATDTTLFMELLALVNVLFHFYAQDDDIVVGVPVSGRDHKDLRDQIGFYVNTIPVRTKINNDGSFGKLLRDTKVNLLDIFRHQHYPFDLLVSDLGQGGSLNRSPVFDVMMVFRDDLSLPDTMADLSIAYASVNSAASKFDLTFNFVESNTGLRFEVEYNSDLFSKDFISSLGSRFLLVAKKLLSQPAVPMKDICYLHSEERDQILRSFNPPLLSYDRDMVLHGLFEAEVKRSPHKVAVLHKDKTVTYEELHRRSNQLGHFLRSAHGIQANDLVGIMVERSEWMLIAILGVLKSGAAYVPIDPGYPEERVRYIVKDSQVKVVLTREEFKGYVDGGLAEVVTLDKAFTDRLASMSASDLPWVNSASDISYIIYTSGSTGRPKGIRILHRNVISFLNWSLEEFSSSVFDILLSGTSYCFDLSVYEFFYPLMTGRQVRILESGLELASYLPLSKRVLVNTVPSVVESLLREGVDLGSVNVLNMAGEPVSIYIKESLDYHRIAVRNLYGPSETTTYSSVYRFSDDHSIIPIGRPAGNSQIYILDGSGRLLPAGVEGELYIGGDGVSGGYLGRADLNSRVFVKNPYGPGQLYKTGDMGRWLPDGMLEFLGRRDHQVKLRGYRIELGEIEQVLSGYAGVEKVLVDARGEGGSKHLVAYYTGDGDIGGGSLQSYMHERLPGYMVPSSFVWLEEFPLTPNGKIDRKSLPSPSAEVVSGKVEGARTPMEASLLKIYAQVLKRGSVGLDDNFFELGGQSIKAIQIISRVSKEFGLKLELKDLFAHPTVRGISGVLSEARRNNYEEITPIAEQAYYDLSNAQKRLWILHQMEIDKRAYNIPAVFKFSGKINKDVLEEAFRLVIKRHESLRTGFVTVAGEPRQRIEHFNTIDFGVLYKDVREQRSAEDLERHLLEVLDVGFELEDAPLLKATLLQVTESTFLFVFLIHHIICDEWSVNVLIREWIQCYNGLLKGENIMLPQLAIQYKDFVHWQNRLLSKAPAHQRYWHEKFSKEVPALALPYDKNRPLVKSYRGDCIKVVLDAELTALMDKAKLAYSASSFNVLVCFVKALLYRLSGQSLIVVGTPVAVRDHPLLENQVGIYLNTVALMTALSPQETFLTLLEKVKDTTLEAYRHKMYPFDKLVSDLQVTRDLSRYPLFDIWVVLQDENLYTGLDQIEGFTIEKIDIATQATRYDLKFSFEEYPNEIVLKLEYSTDLFFSKTVEHFAALFTTLASAMLRSPGRCVSEIPVPELLPVGQMVDPEET